MCPEPKKTPNCAHQIPTQEEDEDLPIQQKK